MSCACCEILFWRRSWGICNTCSLLLCSVNSLAEMRSGARTIATFRSVVPPSPESSNCFSTQLQLFHLVLCDRSPPAPVVPCWVSTGGASQTAAVELLLIYCRVWVQNPSTVSLLQPRAAARVREKGDGALAVERKADRTRVLQGERETENGWRL